jgi:hypothetical protein
MLAAPFFTSQSSDQRDTLPSHMNMDMASTTTARLEHICESGL